ncbi:sensor histidine kinase [Hydrogenimonas cancrithermarum]|uniref:histidine kinase n=1 Tax=Hydrogenimonas cancrithermarum TaxID=2993563 RepID=A0ABM8FMC0_9BACT|nr:HAMP domain-containing sensor histidine kinase [Hydrogenimonas cancrithermarum]BDY12599.1 two-component sensor histidine kinase [Hydrogenimonas cancrithermarum]
MRLRDVEREAFLKSFLLFLGSLTLLMGLLFYNLYTKERINLDNTLFSQMRLCSFDLKCEKFELDFVDAKEKELYLLKRNGEELYAYFPVPGSSRYVMKIIHPMKEYMKEISSIRKELLVEFLVIFFILVILSALFSLYALHPLREALKLTEEFVRDILHDFNTPLSIVRLNVRMLKKEWTENAKIERVEQAVETLLRLQSNLRSYLGGHASQKELFALDQVLEERVRLIEKAFPHLTFDLQTAPMRVAANKDAMIRIVDNLLSNAAKYNKKEGRVVVSLLREASKLVIEDTGIGIEHPDRVFERFYKEHARGVGLGLHIVKKLCDEMGIGVSLTSQKGKGTVVTLDLRKVTLR